ncbi:DUF4857 domain-containing protein [Campylobacter sp. FMV-PI01]|uniref:DUF4857 domain-containing protein n=1 Tax=Campylobacter portucalensis TaxID=2608384 RepID=A0A6L5WHU3_9BACT|nr:DUF4857 domain-containing protein [Campylobacter portucalensis]MSN95807.1 DUF4857 domain-containing protein [Campylobacter portucalensis]
MKISYIKFIKAIIIALILAIFLPRIIDTIFAQKSHKANVYYSEIYDEFIVQTHNPNLKKSFYLKNGDENLTLDEYLEALPFNHYNYLISKNKFPFLEWANSDKIKKHSQRFSLKPEIYNQKKLPVFTIFESNPKYLKLGYNKFALSGDGDKLIFTDLTTLKIDENLSTIFTKALKEKDFIFPIKNHYSNPITKKPFDEGVFLKDSKDEIYHLKMINSHPFVRKTRLKDIDFILVDEKIQREFYGLAITKDNKINLISYDDYKLINLPFASYNPKKDSFKLSITPLSKSISISSEDKIYSYHLDDEFKPIKSFVYEINQNKKAKFIKDLFLPFELILDSSYAYKFKFANFSLFGFILNIILFGVMFYFLKDKNIKFKS